MHCASCVSSVERALREAPGVHSARVNLPLAQAAVDYEPGKTDLARLSEAVAAAGYSASLTQSGGGKSAGAALEERSRREIGTWQIRLILATNAIILANIIFFWFLLTYFDPGWSHYAFYICSAMVSVIAVAQLWTLANQIFTLEEGKRSFGLLAAGGSVGGAVAGFGVKWLLHPSAESHHLLWG